MHHNERPPGHTQPQYASHQQDQQQPYPSAPFQPYNQYQPYPAVPGAEKQSYGWVISTIILSVLLVVAICVIIAMSFRSLLATNTYDPVATVNRVDINEEQLLLSLYSSYPDIIIDEIDYLVRDEVLSQAANARGIKVTDKDLNDELASEKVYFGTAEDFEDYLSYYGMTEDEYKDTLTFTTKLRLLLQSKITVTDEEINQYFEENKNDLGLSSEKIRASQIVVDDYELAEHIIDELNNGESFINLARQYSTDYTAEDGGDLGYITDDYLISELSDVAFSLGINEVSPILSSYEGYHIILKTDYLKPIPASFQDVAHGIKIRLVNEKINEQYSTFVDDLIDQAYIESIVEDHYGSYDEYYDFSDDTEQLANPFIKFYK